MANPSQQGGKSDQPRSDQEKGGSKGGQQQQGGRSEKGSQPGKPGSEKR
jgi:hypothetical protein